MQSDDDCCNSCEEVREAYRKKGWALTNADLVDQVSFANPSKMCFLIFLIFNFIFHCIIPQYLLLRSKPS